MRRLYCGRPHPAAHQNRSIPNNTLANFDEPPAATPDSGSVLDPKLHSSFHKHPFLTDIIDYFINQTDVEEFCLGPSSAQERVSQVLRMRDLCAEKGAYGVR